MPYLILDPVGEYPRHLLSFLGGTLRKAAVAVFTSEGRYLLWRDKWSATLAEHVIETHIAPRWPSPAALAKDLLGRFPEFDGVIPWDEETVLLGARLGELLGLDWNPLRVMRRCRDKAVMKAWLRRAKTLRVNASAVVTDRAGALAFQRRVGRWPIVVKPTEGSGSENVSFPTSDDELLRACEEVRGSGSGEVLLEEYVGGEELVVNGLVDAKSDLLVTDVWHYHRRAGPGGPNLFHTTDKLSTHEPIFREVEAYAVKVVEALGLRRCPIHLEVKVDDRGPCIIEIGARFSGGNLLVLASKLHGRSLLELAACQYVSDVPLRRADVDFDRYDRLEARVLHGIQEVELAPIREVHGVETVEALPSFDVFAKLRAVGQRAPLTRDYDSAAWELSLIGEGRARIDADAATAHRELRYA
jgi:biotin carboxylase